MADSAGMGSPQPGDVVTDGYVQVQDPSTSPGDKFSLENPSNATAQEPAQQAGMGTPPQTRQRAESAPARVAADFASPNGADHGATASHAAHGWECWGGGIKRQGIIC